MVSVTFNSILKPDKISWSVEFERSMPRYHASSGVGNPAASHCSVTDWPTATETSRYGPDVIDGASAVQVRAHNEHRDMY